jgi:ribosome-binding protein aMBF1 (putative translation factor)
MSGRKPFEQLTKDLPANRRHKIEAIKSELRDNMALCELRQAIGISQDTLAERLNVLQPAVAKIERRSDIRVSSLRRLIEAMGGSLEIKAHFPEGDVTITNYSEN